MTTTTKLQTSITLRQVLADAKHIGYRVTRAKGTVNGRGTFHVAGENGLFTKKGLMDLIGVYADSAPLEGQP